MTAAWDQRTVAAPSVDTTTHTGICYAAVTTSTFRRVDDGVLCGMAVDGNGRQTLVEGLDASLGLTHQHLQVLVGHLGDYASMARDYTPGYLNFSGNADGRLVWTLR